jgi:Beta-galactosidase trimerisation domain
VVKTNSYVAAELVSVIEFGNKVLDNYAAVVLADVGQIAPTQAEQLERYVRQGGTLLWFMGEQVNAGSYNDVLLPRKLIPGPLVKLTRVGNNEKGYLFDFDARRMPYLRAFEGQEDTGLDTVETFTYWQVELPPDGSVLPVLRYRAPGAAPTTAPAGVPRTGAPSDPAITVHTLGEGKVVFCSTTANDEWTRFPSNLSYTAVMHELVSSTVRTGDWWLNLAVGQPLAIPPAVRLTATPTLTDPAGRAVEVRAVSQEGVTVYRTDALRRPGIYALQMGTRQAPVAVNVPPEEADVRVMPDAAVREALGGIELALLGPELPADAALDDTGNDLSWVFMLLVLGLLAVECIMAMHFGHYRRAAPVPTEAAGAVRA